jgi:hypothetical protein
MRNFILATLLVSAAGCASARQPWHARYDHSHPNGPNGPGWQMRGIEVQEPIDVSRQTEPGAPGPTRGAPDSGGRR